MAEHLQRDCQRLQVLVKGAKTRSAFLKRDRSEPPLRPGYRALPSGSLSPGQGNVRTASLWKRLLEGGASRSSKEDRMCSLYRLLTTPCHKVRQPRHIWRGTSLIQRTSPSFAGNLQKWPVYGSYLCTHSLHGTMDPKGVRSRSLHEYCRVLLHVNGSMRLQFEPRPDESPTWSAGTRECHGLPVRL